MSTLDTSAESGDQRVSACPADTRPWEGTGKEGNISGEAGKDYSGHVTTEEAASWREQVCGYLGDEHAK